MTQVFVSKNNSTTIPLGANATFVGESDILTSFQEIDITVGGAPSVAPGTLYFEYSPNGTNWDVSVPLSLTGPSTIPVLLRTVLPYFRVRYINGNTALTEFRLTVLLHRTASIRLTRFLSQEIDINDPVDITRSIIAGKSPNGSYYDIALNSNKAILIDGSAVIQPVSGTVSISGTTTISGTVTANQGTNPWTDDVIDRAGRLLGVIYGSQGQQLKQTATNFNTQIEIAVGATLIDPRQIRALTSSDVVTANAGSGTFTVGGTITANIGTTNGLALDSTIAKLTIAQSAALGSNTQILVGGSVTTAAPTYTTGNINPLSLTTSGLLRVDGSGVTQPVSGTVTANAGTGTFTVAGSITANIGTTGGLALDATLTGGTVKAQMYDGANVIGTSTHPVRVDPTGTTIQPVSGTITANQGGAPWTVIGTLSDNTANSTAKIAVIAAKANTSAPSWTDGNQAPLSVIAATGALRSDNSSWLGSTAPTVGSKTSANSIPVVIASDQSTVSTINASIGSNNTAIPTSSTLVGGSDGTNVRPFKTDNKGDLAVYFGDSPSVTAFSSVRTAEPLTLFSNKQIFNSQPLYWDDQQTSGSGTSSTFLTNKAATQMTVTQNLSGIRVRQSFRRMNYQPGKSQLALLTGVLVNEGGIGNAAVDRRIGLFDENNGFFFELTGTTMNIVIRTSTSGSPITTYIAQSNWNLDKLDGTGSSGFTLDVSKSQIFIIDFQWLGTGRIRYGFSINGTTLYCHQILVANLQSLVSISNPNLPVRFEIQSLGTGSASTSSMQHICATVISEGGQEDVGFTFGVDTGATSLTTGNNTNVYALLALQLQNGMLSAAVEPTHFSVLGSTNNTQFKVVLVLNPTVAGTALSYTPVANSALQFAVGVANNTITGGTVIYSEYFQSNKTGAASDNLTIDIALGSTIAGVSDTLVLAIQPTPAAAATFFASFNWKEQI